jgi:DNA primase
MVDAGASRASVLQLHDQVDRHYQRELGASRAAQTYLDARGISAAVAQRFGLGFAPDRGRNLASILSSFREVDTLASGLLTPGHGAHRGQRFDRFRNRLMFPIRDAGGAVVGFAGRLLCDEDGSKASGAKYLNSPQTCIFDKGSLLYGLHEAQEAIRARDLAVVVEGYIDVIAAAQAGFEAVVATMGTACTARQLHQLFSLTDEVVFCFDGDAAGRRAATSALQTALPWISRERSVRFAFLHDSHDPDSFIRQYGLGAFESVIARATSAFEFLVEQAQDGCNLAWIEGRARAAHFAGACWARLGPSSLADSLLRYFAALLKFSVEELRALWVDTHMHSVRDSVPVTADARAAAPRTVADAADDR